MKKVFQKSGAFAMAFLMLFSTMSFTVEKHFCGQMLVDLAVFSEAETCGMEMHMSSSEEKTEDNCCKEQKISVEGQKDLKMSFDQLDFPQQLFVASFAYSYMDLFVGLPEQVIPFKDYSPPLLVRDIQLMDQTFLI